MQAVRLVGPQRFEFTDVDVPAPKQGEVLVKIEALSVCGSDLRSYDRVLPEEQYPLPIGRPCHEVVGVIEESLADNIKRGQRVIAVTNQGGMVEYAAVTSDLIVPVPDSLDDPSLWVLCQPVGTVIYAMQKLGSVLGKKVVVLGQGPIGLTFTEFLARGGASQVIVTDVIDFRLETAKRLGATHTINAAREDVAEAVKQITGGEMADITIEACGRPETCHQAFEVLKRLGTSVIFGMTHTEDIFEFNWAMMYSKLPNIIVTNSAAAGERVDNVKIAVDLVNQGRFDVAHMVTHRLSWKDVSRAFELYSKKNEESLKVLMSVS
jgi:threonine dehydrogenase-like Zn-dependent dehydrogenase